MGVQKKTRKFAQVKRVIGQRDARLKKNILKNEGGDKKKDKDKSDELIREVYVLPARYLEYLEGSLIILVFI